MEILNQRNVLHVMLIAQHVIQMAVCRAPHLHFSIHKNVLIHAHQDIMEKLTSAINVYHSVPLVQILKLAYPAQLIHI